MTPTPAPGPLAEPDLRDAVQAALAAEHAAIWSYGLTTAFLPATATPSLGEGARTHRERRDALEALLGAAGVAPVPAAAAYRTPSAVGDALSAAVLLGVAEEDVAAAWRAVCERAEAGDTPVRGLAVDAVVSAATLGARWRRLADREPAVAEFPGFPGG